MRVLTDWVLIHSDRRLRHSISIAHAQLKRNMYKALSKGEEVRLLTAWVLIRSDLGLRHYSNHTILHEQPQLNHIAARHYSLCINCGRKITVNLHILARKFGKYINDYLIYLLNGDHNCNMSVYYLP